MSVENKSIKFTPDNNVNSQTPVETADELKSFDKKMGGISTVSYTHLTLPTKRIV